MNQNLLIVDDEYDILMWLEDMFKHEFDMEIDVYTAMSASEALKLLNQVKFDVVLTDIKMPRMDGISLFQKIKSNWPRCKTVFLTGYRNFDDMYKNINHKDVRFILKSEEDEVIQQAVREALNEFRQELERETLNQIQKEDIEKAKYWMCREFIDGLLNGETDSRQKIQEGIEKYGIPVDFCRQFLMFLIKTDNNEKSTGFELPTEVEAINRIIKSNIPQDIRRFMYTLEKRQAVLIIQPSAVNEQDWQRLFAVAQGAIEYAQVIFRRNFSESFSAVITAVPISYTEIPVALIKLKQIMIGYLGSEKEIIVHAESLKAGYKEEKEVRIISRVPLLKSYMELHRRQNYFELLSECCKELTGARSRHDAYATEIYYSVSVLILQFINENEFNEKIAFETGIYKLTRVDEHDSWQAAAQYLFEISDAVFRLLGENDNVLSDRALRRIEEYIDMHLDGDLSLTNLADIGGFNASYLSRLFKQNYRMNITDYIYQKRMEYAKSLLSETNQKIQDIGEKAGYHSAQSFTRTFRNYSGLSPAEYRELYRKEVKQS